MKNHTPPKPLIHRSIRALRREREISQLEVAKKLRISQSQYSLFEQGYIELPEALLRRLYRLLGSGNTSTGGRSSV